MQLSIKLTLLGLAVTSTAIDIMFYTLSYCGGSRIGCERWNPDVSYLLIEGAVI